MAVLDLVDDRGQLAAHAAIEPRAEDGGDLVGAEPPQADRAKAFYGSLGWRLDADFAAGDDFRVIQFTPPGSGCSVIFGKNVTAAAPGSAQGLYLIVSDIGAARDALLGRGVEISDVFDGAGTCTPARTSLTCSGGSGSAGRIPSMAAIARSPRSAIPTAMAGCSRRLLSDCPDAWTRTARHLRRRLSSRMRCDVRPQRTASTRSAHRRGLVRRVHRPGAGGQAAAVVSSDYGVHPRPAGRIAEGLIRDAGLRWPDQDSALDRALDRLAA